MDYMTLKEAAEKWGVTPRRVNYYCAGGRIPGAVKMAGVWLLPKTAEKPLDGREGIDATGDLVAVNDASRGVNLLGSVHDLRGVLHCGVLLAFDVLIISQKIINVNTFSKKSLSIFSEVARASGQNICSATRKRKKRRKKLGKTRDSRESNPLQDAAIVHLSKVLPLHYLPQEGIIKT